MSELHKRAFVCWPRGILQALGFMSTPDDYYRGHHAPKVSLTERLCLDCDELFIIAAVARDVGREFEKKRDRAPASRGR